MFNKKKKNTQTKKEEVTFKSENYEMPDKFLSENLLVGNLEYVSSAYTPYGPMIHKTKQRYIFEKTTVDGEEKYREIFTGFIAGTESCYFDLPYAVDLKPIKELITNVAEQVPKYGMLLLLDEVNKIQKVKVKEKVKEKTK